MSCPDSATTWASRDLYGPGGPDRQLDIGLDLLLAHSLGSVVILATLMSLGAHLLLSFYISPLLWLLHRLLVAYPLATLNPSRVRCRIGGYSLGLSLYCLKIGGAWLWWVLACKFGVLLFKPSLGFWGQLSMRSSWTWLWSSSRH